MTLTERRALACLLRLTRSAVLSGIGITVETDEALDLADALERPEAPDDMLDEP